MSLYIGIEGVALTDSFAVAADSTGALLATFRLPAEPLSLHTMERKQLRARLAKLIRGVTSLAGHSLDNLYDTTICIGLAGANFPYDGLQVLPREFEQLEIQIGRLVCAGDAEIAFAAYAHRLTGSALVCHMGSSALVASDGRFVRYGGWGPAIGDQGSGYWIGLQALRVLAQQYDRGEGQSPLWCAVDAWLSEDHDDDYPDWSYASLVWKKLRDAYDKHLSQSDPRTALFQFAHEMSLERNLQWRTVVSALTIPIMRAHAVGDPSATYILTRAARHLSMQYVGACVRAGVQPVFGPLVLFGGVLTRTEHFRKILLDHLSELSSGEFRIVLPESSGSMRPAFGALMYALGDSKTGMLRLPPEPIIERIVSAQDKLGRSTAVTNGR